MKLTKLANLLQSHLQDEQSVQNRMRALLEDQEKAALAGDTEGMETFSREIEKELEGEPLRQKRRNALMDAFGGELGIPAQLLTIGSLLERLQERGVSTTGLNTVRNDLKEALLGVRKLSRKMMTIARGHGEVLCDVMRLLAGSDERTPGTGLLVDAEV